MGEQTEISWTDHTFNTHWGCVEVSPACGLPLPGEEDKPHGTCYAKTWDARFPILGQAHWGKEAPRRFFGDDHWRQPITWNKKAQAAGIRKRAFCGSMCDIMEDRRDLDEPRARVFELVRVTPWIDWLFLTKRPQNYAKMLPPDWLDNPQPNVWLGTTLETPAYIWRADELRKLKAAVKWLSMEPLLLPFTDAELHATLHGIDWAIFGGESGNNARSSDIGWFERGIAIARTEGTTPFMKQMGSAPVQDGGCLMWVPTIKDKAGANPAEWPDKYRVQEFPKARVEA